MSRLHAKIDELMVTKRLNVSNADSSTATEGFQLDGVKVTATAAEINKLAVPTLTTIDQTALYTVGQVFIATDGKAYCYIQGVASTVTGDWLSFIVTSATASTTVRSIANAIGPCGIAQGALIAGDFGWVQIFGLSLIAGAISGGDAAAGAVCYLTATAGLVDDVAVDGDSVHGATFTVQEDGAVAGVWLNYPYTDDIDNIS